MSARRANRRWLDGNCPAGVLAIFDNRGKTIDRYTVLYVPAPGSDRVEFFAASVHPFDPQGFGQHGDMPAHEARAYRYAATSAKESATWSSLPADVQSIVRRDLAEREPLHRLEALRVELRAERLSWGELAELQSLASFIDPSDVELLEAAGVPERGYHLSDCAMHNEPAEPAGSCTCVEGVTS